MIGCAEERNAEGNDQGPTEPGQATPSGSTAVSDDGSGVVPTSPKGKLVDSGPLGISVVYTPDHGHKVDIVFVHGLGGTSRWTWSKNKEAELFWPQTFLPLEPDICQARIMTFGYNASLGKTGNVTTSVFDFAKGLLFDLKYAKNDKVEDLGVGKVPLMFVVHSMGGLIVKEAYMQGKNDPEYEDIIKAVCAITFLSTPHRGTSLAHALNRILDAFMLNSKRYVADLTKNSATIQKLNEQFRHIAPRLDIVSFYETQPTSIGLKRIQVMVLENYSSVLGYPGEVSKALDADHHSVCKYWGPHDPNYIAVRNVLKSLVSKQLSKDNVWNGKPDLKDRRASLDVKYLLAISDAPSMDYIFFRDQWTQGTNGWILDDPAFLDWQNAPGPDSRLIWLGGGAATGKSVISAFVVNHLAEKQCWCQYFFIRFGDRKKRTLSLLIRSLAYQLGLCVPGFLQKIEDLVDEAIDFETADPRIIWDSIFKSILFKWEKQGQPLYWVIDGLDEADDPRAVIKLLSDIALSSVSIRILFTSRRTFEIITAFDKASSNLKIATLRAEGHLDDLRQHIRRELTVLGSAEFRDEIERRIIDLSDNNFLWVRLAVDKVNQCHTYDDVDLAIRQLPVGMEALYDRMAASIAQYPNPSNKALVTGVLECISCSVRVLNVTELSQALGSVASEILDLQRTIMDLCGGFVVLDNSGNVAMVHQTARDYLILDRSGDDRPFHVDRQTAHKRMFLASMRCLMSTGVRAKLASNREPELLQYASGSWSAHLDAASPSDQGVVNTLKKFLTANWALTWVYVLASSGQLRALIQTSRDLSRFVAKRKQALIDSGSSVEGMSVPDLDLFEGWAVDMLRIVGKFGNMLRRQPDSIYKRIPPFCPTSSSLYRLFGKAEAKNLSVIGLSAEAWDDSLARIPVGHGPGVYASILATRSLIAILSSAGSVFLHDSSDFTELQASPVRLGERVDRMQLNSTATLLATYGYHTTKVWEVSTGKCKVSVDSVESKTRPLAMLFTDSHSTLLVGTDDRRVRSLNLEEPQPEWQVVAELEETELEGPYMLMNSASHMAFSPNGSMVAIAYRSHPVSAWETDGPTHIAHCWRKDLAAAIRELRELVWHPRRPEIVGLNIEGVVFRWAPYDGTIDELPVAANKLSIAKHGELFATGDSYGRVKIYTTSSFSLLYHLTAQDAVLGMTFSPDSRRLYDIRGYYANAWEPGFLERLVVQSSKHADSGNERQSFDQPPEALINTSRAVSSITALAGSPRGRLYCCGTDRGVVSLYDTQHGKLEDIYVSVAKFYILKVVWSGDGTYLCFTDTSKEVKVMSVAQGAGVEATPAVEQRATIPIRKVAKGPILQLLFDPDSSRLLVHTSSQTCTISLALHSVEESYDWKDTVSQWIVHPREPALIVGFGPDDVHVLDWNLVVHRKYSISWPSPDKKLSNVPGAPSPPPDSVYQVDRVLVTHDKKHVFLQTSCPTDNSQGKQFFHVQTSDITLDAAATPPGPTPLGPQEHECQNSGASSIHPTALTENLSSKIALPLSFLPRDRLVFLSKSFAICSAQVHWNPGPVSFRPVSRSRTTTTTVSGRGRGGARGAVDDTTVQELFGLPGDWISRDCLDLCSIWGVERSFLCPRNGEAAVVRCAAIA